MTTSSRSPNSRTSSRSACTRYKTAPGAMLNVYQWNYAVGNQPDPQHRDLRAALDAASTTQPHPAAGR